MATAQELFKRGTQAQAKIMGQIVGGLGSVNIITATVIPKPVQSQYPSGANKVMLCAAAAFNVTLDGTAPTTSTGFTFAANTTYVVDIPENATLTAISTTGTALQLQYQWLAMT